MSQIRASKDKLLQTDVFPKVLATLKDGAASLDVIAAHSLCDELREGLPQLDENSQHL